MLPTHILAIDVELPDVRSSARLLELLARADARATCFVAGGVASEHPALVQQIAAAGHELASGELAQRCDAASFSAELANSCKLLEDATGARVQGFRAVGRSLTPGEAWAFDVLIEHGFRYDASLRGGDFPASPRGPHVLRCRAGALIEVPTSGLRRLPYALLAAGLALERGLGHPASICVRPREQDAHAPCLARLLARHRFVGVSQWLRERAPDLIGREVDLRAPSA